MRKRYYNCACLLYVCETWSLTLREERRLRVFKNSVLRDAETEGWRKLHNLELNYRYSSLNIVWVIKSEKNEMGGACSLYGREERYIQGFGGEI
jgi:hypothetical protein